MKALSTIPSAAYHELIDYAVVDRANESVGTLHSLWSDQHTGALEFLGVKTGWLFGSNHVVPTAQAQVDDASRTIQVPYDLALIKEAPAIAAEAEISEEEEAEIYRYYGVGGGVGSHATTETSTTTTTGSHTTTGGVASTVAGLTAGAATTTATTTATTGREAARSAGETIEVALQEEQMRVGKRSVESGGVRLRKIIRTETVHTPVELRREEVVVERVAAADLRPGDLKAADFKEQDINVTLHREEAVVAKETVVTGAVRLRKTAQTETQTGSDTVRKEDVEVVREAKTSELTPDAELTPEHSTRR